MKDYKKLEEKINSEKEITIGDITDLGFSRYDINQFIAAGILSRSKRGIYAYLPKITKEEISNENPNESKEETALAFAYVDDGIRKIMKRENLESINSFEKALEIEENNSRAIMGLIGAYIFLEEYEEAYTQIIRFYNTRQDNLMLHNLYYYLLILKEHVTIDMNFLNELKQEIETRKDTLKKINPNFKRLYKALDNDDYLEALKYVNYSISIDKKDKKYHITNHIYKALVMATLRIKGINPFAGVIAHKESKGETFYETNQIIETSTPQEPEELIIIPTTNTATVIKRNLLLEAINNNDFDKALSLLEEEQINNPEEIIKTLLSKLATIKSLITTANPIKVVETQPVHVVKEQYLDETIEVAIEKDEVPKQKIKQEIINIPQTTQSQASPQKLAQIAYKAYKEAYHSEQFDAALKNLRRYEFLCNSNETGRNINYHYIRIERSKKDFEQNPERYIKKKALSRVIFDLKKEKRYDAALAAIEEFKTLGGIKNEQVIIVEAEIHYILGNTNEAETILKEISESEEPSFLILSSKISFRNSKFQETLSYCQAYNERRPNQSPSNYQLIGDCYTKLGKSGKAVKAYRKAEEVAAQYGGKTLDLSKKINKQEAIADFRKEERDARNLGKKK